MNRGRQRSRPLFQRVFRSGSEERDSFLARLFGIFNEQVVHAWCDCRQAPYSNMGRPTVREPGEDRGYTLDFTLRHRCQRTLGTALPRIL